MRSQLSDITLQVPSSSELVIFFVSLVSPVAARGACSIEKAVHELSFKEAMERAMIDIYHSKLSEASACSKKDYWCASSE